MAVAKKRQLESQEEDRADDQEEASRNTRKGPWPLQWLRGAQPRTQEDEDDHNDGQEE
jgi:hypothetical protein